MKIYIQAVNYHLWRVIVNGPQIPLVRVNGMDIPKPEEDWDDNDMQMGELNAKAMNVLYCALDSTKFNRISTCTTAQENWNKLEVTNEGTSQVKSSKINLLVHNYELFKMDPNESISAMFTRFTDIINGLKCLGRNYSNADLVQKILRSLPDRWDPKVTAIQGAKDINNLSLDELMGSLITHELTLQHRNDDEIKKKKPIALKAAMEEKEELSLEETLKDEQLGMLVRKFKKYMDRRNSYNRRNPRKLEINEEKDKDKNKNKEQKIICHNCKKPSHVRYECPLLKSFDKKKLKRAMFGAWTDNESSSSSSSEEEQQSNFANFCLMAHQEDKEPSSDYDFTFEELKTAFDELMLEFIKAGKRLDKLKVINEDLIKEKNEFNNKYDSLRDDYNALSSKSDILKEENKAHIVKIESLESENSNLKREIQKLKPFVEKMTLSSKKLELLLSSKRDSDNKTGIGYNSSNSNRISKYTSASTSKSYPNRQKVNFENYRHVRTLISTTKPHATTSNNLRNAFNEMAQTLKPSSKGVTYTFLNSASLDRKVVDRKIKLVDRKGPKVAWVPKPLP